MNQFASRTRGTPSLRLASVPNMLGDFGMVFQKTFLPPSYAVADLPLAGGGLRTKISENNKALPMDRVYFQYNHFHNAFDVDFATGTGRNDFSDHLDRYTIGLEKTFHDKLWSVELRMPFASTPEFSSWDLNVSGGEIGNLNAIVKRLLVAGHHGALAAGIGINTPTGSDVQVSTFESYLLENEAVHLSPFLGALYRPNNRFFYHGFLELDVPLNGNPVVLDNGGPVLEGILTEQTLLQIDVSAGYWLYRNPHAVVTGLASIIEFHYTGTLNDADVLDTNAGHRFGSLQDRSDLIHLTVGLHARHRNTTLNIGGVFPLNDEPDRAFDAEFQVALNRYF